MGIICKKTNSDESIDHESNANNCLYMWGSNKYGQLGLWDFDNRVSPTFMDSDFDPVSIVCGHTFSIVQS